MRFLPLISTLILLMGFNAHAIFEVKAGYGALASKGNFAPFYGGSSSDIPSAVPNAGLTLDAVFKIPLLGFGVGMRSESMKIDYDSTLLGIENSLNRTSLIINYRLIDTVLYVGPIFTYGINHSNNIKLTSGSTTLNDISSTSVSSYSLGVEVGASLLGMMVGAEAGTHQMKYNSATDAITPSKVHDIDMSGPYAKIFVGFGI